MDIIVLYYQFVYILHSSLPNSKVGRCKCLHTGLTFDIAAKQAQFQWVLSHFNSYIYVLTLPIVLGF